MKNKFDNQNRNKQMKKPNQIKNKIQESKRTDKIALQSHRQVKKIQEKQIVTLKQKHKRKVNTKY